ncbi:MAG: glycyl-radical enzyme activating protein [Anaerolineae bacterium]
MKGLIFDIQRFSVHDGPGIRTTVFFKGCSLRCFWCHNPEGLRAQREIRFVPDRCIVCGACVTVCPEGAHVLAQGRHIYYRERCRQCGQCVETCYAEALQQVGRLATVEEVVQDILSDRAFYDTSGGGVTLSGGEPVLQPEFAAAILARCREERIHTAIETAGHYPWEQLARLLPLLDLVIMDLKHIDPGKHRWATGASNERILANARLLAQSGANVLFRVPVIPTVNDTPEEIGAIAAFVRDLSGERRNGASAPGPIPLELLPFHRLAASKYRSLGMRYEADELTSIPRERLDALAEAARSHHEAVIVQ